MPSRSGTKLSESETRMSGRSLQEAEFVEGADIRLESRSAVSTNSDEVIFLRLPEVKTMTGLSKSSLYALIRAKSFPAPVQLGPRTVAWVKSEVRQWAVERVTASRSPVSFPVRKRMPQRSVESWASSRKSA